MRLCKRPPCAGPFPSLAQSPRKISPHRNTHHCWHHSRHETGRQSVCRPPWPVRRATGTGANYQCFNNNGGNGGNNNMGYSNNKNGTKGGQNNYNDDYGGGDDYGIFFPSFLNWSIFFHTGCEYFKIIGAIFNSSFFNLSFSKIGLPRPFLIAL